MPELDILACVLCEETRQEASGQSIIIGAMNKGPNVKRSEETVLPRLGFYIEATSKGVETMRMQLIDLSRDSIAFEDQFDLSMEERINDLGGHDDWKEIEAKMQLVVNLVDVKIPHSGEYTLQTSLDGGDWIKVREFMFFPMDEPTKSDPTP